MRDLIIVVSLMGVIGSGAYYKGRSDEAKKHTDIQIQFHHELQIAEQRRLDTERELMALQEVLHGQAVLDPHADRLSFGTDSLHRLNQIQ